MAKWLKEGIDAEGFAIYKKRKRKRRASGRKEKKKETQWEQLALTF